MNPHALNVLEFRDLLQVIAGYTQTAAGRTFIQELCPCTELRDITTNRELYANTIGIFDDGGTVPGLHAEPLGEILRRVRPEGAMLFGEDLILCRKQLETVLGVKRFLQTDVCRTRSALQRIGQQLDDCPSLRDALVRCLDDDGSVLDSASSALRDIRRQISDLERRIQHLLERLVKTDSVEGVIQERFVTSRNGRFVIPVKRSEKAALPGIIHDHSNSGQTLFVEPADTIPLGNALADARLEERDEILRILGQLSARVREHREDLSRNEESLALLDAAFAIARWAHAYHCILPAFAGHFLLCQARHPLLQRRLREDNRENELVPLDAVWPEGTRALVITGSNTGGKTVALKTMGLLALAAQSGLPVPVGENSRFEIFTRIYADIGDEQSLEANLSTFSAHLRNITEILNRVGNERSLILLDELGAGTDPLEGGALACAFLAELTSRNALTIATTHLGVVKTFVHERRGMLNASVRFNTEDLKPEYILDIGRPGASHAILIAERLQVPGNVLKTARRLLSEDHLRLETVLAKMEDEQRRLSDREEAARGAQEELVRNRDQLRKELQTLRTERRVLMNEAYKQAAGIVENTRKQMEQQLRELKEHPATYLQPASPHVKSARNRLTEKKRRLEEGIEQTQEKPAARINLDQLSPGDRVWVPKVNAEGRILSFSDARRKVTVDVNGLSVSLKTSTLGAPRTDEAVTKTPAPTVKITHPRAEGRTPHELNLVGQRVDRAIPHLERFIDRAALARLPEVRIVHGFGSGRLHDAVTEWLGASPLVMRQRAGVHGEDPGGAGVTIAVLQPRQQNQG